MADDGELLTLEGIQLGCVAADRDDAIRQTGELLVALGAVEQGYPAAMHEREHSLSSYVGEGFALPHGTDESRALIRRAAVVFLQFPDGVPWDEGEKVRACLGIAAAADEHVSVMSRLARVLINPAQAEELRTTTDPGRVLELLSEASAGVPDGAAR